MISRETRERFSAACSCRIATWSSEARAAWPHDDFPKVVTKRAPTPEEWNALGLRGGCAAT